MEDTVKQLKIKTGSVRRILREFSSYEEELVIEQARLEKLRDAGADIHDLKKQEEVIAETNSMLPNTRKRLQEAVEDLACFFEENEEDEALRMSEEWAVAQQFTLEAQSSVLSS
jgi:tubulin-specific chaperone A